MSWWRQPFTLLYVPHDGSNPRTFSFKRITFVCLLFLGAFFLSTGVLLSLYGLLPGSHSTPSASSSYTSSSTDSSESSPNSQLRRTIQSLRKQLQKTRRKHRAILKVAGIYKPDRDKKHAPRTIQTWMKKGEHLLDRSIRRNQQLKRLKKFVQSRNKVFRHTPTLWPTEGWLSSPYGYRKDPMGGKGKSFHEGVDIAAWQGTPVRATADGKVVFSGRKSGYGNIISIRHEYGYKTLYGHLSKRLVEEGQRVTKGMAVGRVGNTGHSTGSHVHYEILVNGKIIDPWPYLVEQFQSYKQYAMKGESS